ncbi:DNA/RNA non-specific endonuclease [Parvularcula flava]|uniref:DNA/RNA non-specific endonuclease n=1 Tax=Aquisalinus luteolus TaxID=1566827 RepID=A0A8J3ETM1_9PROT|nr:DNA/RNA non-specific endonuclease [Aquisalinus luteolus]NHK27108.1 DNA/RNA non-specific endonuclease [Aquisalinus luteolus]GGH94398.1 hypothetical protein GCM10011355_08490 [Aquisalinus luteolus]
MISRHLLSLCAIFVLSACSHGIETQAPPPAAREVAAAPAQAAFTGPLRCESLSGPARERALGLHAFGGVPSDGPVLVRRAYVTEYDAAHRTPRWTAWHAAPSYRETPKREGRWSSFRSDPDVEDPVGTRDYVGQYASPDNFARGHLAPYYISGGDRDGDELLAALASDRVTLSDPDDACAVYEINYMTNIAPQYHAAFNGTGDGGQAGLWYQLETEIRGLVDQGTELHLFAGTIYADAPQRVGPDQDIAVPDMFYKIIIQNEEAVAFLFAHRRRLSEDACALDAVLEDCITTIAEIERLTGLDFLAGLSDAREQRIENANGVAAWRSWSAGRS